MLDVEKYAWPIYIHLQSMIDLNEKDTPLFAHVNLFVLVCTQTVPYFLSRLNPGLTTNAQENGKR